MQKNIDVSSSWVSVDVDSWQGVYKGFTTKKYKKKAMIYNQGEIYDKVFIIAKGRARVMVLDEEGNEKQLYIAETGTLCCESCTILKKPYFSSCMALVDCEVYEIPVDVFLERIKNNWDLTMHLLNFMSRKSMMFAKDITSLSFEVATQRVCRTLIDLCNQYGVEDRDGIKINVKFTHQDVAGLVNSSRVTVSNIFTMLSDKGILHKKGGFFKVKDIDDLQEYLDA